MNKSRDYRLDLLRIIAISKIVLMHSPLPNSAPGYILSGISYITASGLVLFFMISGALLLDSDLSTKEFMRKRFSKIAWPTLFWTLFYLAVKFANHPFQAFDALRQIVSIPFSAQGHGVLWFMYTLAGLYLLTPVLSRWLRHASKREIEFYLMLWGVTLMYPYLSLIFITNESDTGILYYFTGYVGYFVLGYYLKHDYVFRTWHVIVALAVAAVIPALLYSSGIEFDFYRMLWYLSLPVALMAFSWYVLIMRLPNKSIAVISKASSLSFGLYLIHIFVMRDFLWHLDMILSLSGVLQILTITVLTILISFLISWLLSRLPFSKYIIGA